MLICLFKFGSLDLWVTDQRNRFGYVEVVSKQDLVLLIAHLMIDLNT